MWSPNAHLENLYHTNKPEFSFQAKSTEEWEQWRSSLKQAFIEDLGGFPEVKAPLAAKLLEVVEYDDYIREKIEITTFYDMRMPVYVLIPKNATGKLPAVIACHGHGYGSKDIVGLNPDGTEKQEADPGYQKNFAVELVKKGFLVIAPEILGFGSRKLQEDADTPPKENSCFRISTHLLMLGKTMAGYRVYEILRCIDYLESRDIADISRIGCMGISGGGLVAGFAAAIDERIKVAVVSGYVNTFKESILRMHHCLDNYIPSILKHAEEPDIIGLIAPRPLLIEAGIDDPIFPIESTLKAYEKLEEIYGLLDAPQHLDKDVFEGGHMISGAKAYTWFDQLK